MLQATWPAMNAPNALLMQAIDAPLPDDPPDDAPATKPTVDTAETDALSGTYCAALRSTIDRAAVTYNLILA